MNWNTKINTNQFVKLPPQKKKKKTFSKRDNTEKTIQEIKNKLRLLEVGDVKKKSTLKYLFSFTF